MKKRHSGRRIFRRFFGPRDRTVHGGCHDEIPLYRPAETSGLVGQPFHDIGKSVIEPVVLLSRSQGPGVLPLALAPESTPIHGSTHEALSHYLLSRENTPFDIDRLLKIMEMAPLILEIGCGNAEIAWEIALKNPLTGVIATDLYEYPCSTGTTSGYGWVAKAWKNDMLPAQIFGPPNLVVLRAEAEIMRFMPAQCLDSILLINPEPDIGKAFLKTVSEQKLMDRVKSGSHKIVIKPYSSDMGMAVFGGFEFDQSPDRSRGLGFLLESDFVFTRGGKVQWAVDLNKASRYSGNSTQCDVYVHDGTLPAAVKKRTSQAAIEKFFRIHTRKK